MSDLDDLRNLTAADDDFTSDNLEQALAAQEIAAAQANPRRSGRFLGMTAGQRAFLSVVVFFNVLLIGMALLIITGRLQV